MRSTQKQMDRLVSLALFVAALLLYVQTMAPTIVEIYDDSLEFPLVVHRLAIAHPTGYPLYTLVGKLFTLLPAGDVAHRLHIFSALCAAGAVAVLYLAARRVGLRPVGALAAGLFLAVSPVFWSQALIAEVYTLNALFVVVLLALAVQWGEGQRAFGGLAALAAALGLSLTHHRTIVLIVPALAVYMLLASRQARRPPAQPSQISSQAGGNKMQDAAPVRASTPLRWRLLILLALFCLPSLLYLYLPLRGMVTSSLDGTYVNTLGGFLSWVTGSAYTTFLRDNPLQQEAFGARAYLSLLRQQIGLAGLALVALGAAWLALNRTRVFVLFAVSWLVVVLFVYFYRVADAPVFLIPSFVMAAWAAGAGVSAIAGRLPSPQPAPAGDAAASSQTPPLAEEQDQAVPLHPEGSRKSASVILTWLTPIRLAAAYALAVLAPVIVFTSNIHELDRSTDWAVHNYATDVLSQPLQPGAAIVGILGEVTLLRYYQETQAMRPEVETVAADTREQQLAAVNRLVQQGRPVYLTRPLAGIENSFALRAVGPLIQVVGPQAETSGALPSGSIPSQAVFGERMALLSYRLSGLPPAMNRQTYPQVERNGVVESGGRLRVEMSWQATQPVQADYHLTVRLMTPTGRLLWQSDGRPVHGNYPTNMWRTGEVVRDVYDLLVPIGTPPGLYDIEIGVYNGATMQLLPVGGRPELLAIGPVAVARPATAPSLDSLPVHSPGPQKGLTIPGGTFDYSLERMGIQRTLRGNLQNEFTLYGFGLSSTPLVPGQGVEVMLLWQASRQPSGDRVVFVQLVDEKGNLWASHESQPGEGAYPTRQWTRDEVIRDVHNLLLPADIPNGAYRLEAGMYDPSGEPLTVLRLTRRSLDHVDLGTVQVRGRARSQEIPPALQHTVSARIGNVATLVGYDQSIGDAEPDSAVVLAARPAQTLHLRLVWQAMEPAHTSYTVFVHLLSPDGKVVSQDDSIPGRGSLPTTGWVRGEVIQDTALLPIPGAAVSGVYQIEIGLYDAVTGNRLPVWDSTGVAIGDSLMLPSKVRVERAP